MVEICVVICRLVLKFGGAGFRFKEYATSHSAEANPSGHVITVNPGSITSGASYVMIPLIFLGGGGYLKGTYF